MSSDKCKGVVVGNTTAHLHNKATVTVLYCSDKYVRGQGNDGTIKGIDLFGSSRSRINHVFNVVKTQRCDKYQ